MNRRRFLSRLSLGIGSVALGSLMIPDLFSGSADEKALMAGLTAFCAQSKTHYLSFSKRSAFATGFV